MVKKKISSPDTIEFLYKEFEKESDRAAAILAVSLIDEALNTLLKSYFVPIPNSTDPLFDGANAPVGTFSSKITISHRLGLISANLCRDIHLLRKIRNLFAHDIYGCNFKNGSIKSRIIELDKSITRVSLDNFREVYESGLKKKIEEGPRGDFLILSGFILDTINKKISTIEKLNEGEKEYCYMENIKVDKDIDKKES